MDRQSSQAIESLQISNSDSSVKCQRCGIAVPIVGKLIRTGNDRIAVLQKRIKWLENYHYAPHHQGNINKDNEVKQLKQELAALLEEDATYHKLGSLPLYSCRITGWKFVCSRCYDRVYNRMVLQRS